MNSEVSMLRSLTIQGRVLHALLMREVITRFGRDNLGVLWLIVEPMLFTLGVSALWTAAGFNHGSSIPIVAFAITGYSSVLLWRNATSRCCMAIEANLGLLFHRNVQVIDLFSTRILLEIAGATASFILLSLFFISIGWMSAPVDILEVIFGWLMLCWFAVCLAMLIGAGTARSDIVEKLWQPGAYLLFPLSGAAFMVDWLPIQAQQIVLLLPMVHGVEILRDGYFGNAVKTHFDIGYMAVSCLILSLAALYLVRDAGQKAEQR